MCYDLLLGELILEGAWSGEAQAGVKVGRVRVHSCQVSAARRGGGW